MRGYLEARTPFSAGRLVEARGVKLWCQDSGGDGEPLLLLGGPSVGHFHFDFVRPHLAGYRLITWEPRGFACSDLTGPYSVDTWTADLVHLLDALGVDRAHVWANGFSSYIAFAIAAQHPDRVGAVIASTDVWAGEPAKGYATAWAAYREIIAEHGTTGEGADRLAALYTVRDPPWFEEWFSLSVGEVLHASNISETIGYLCTEADVRDRLSEIRAPVFVLLGDRGWDGAPLPSGPNPSLDLLRRTVPGLEVATVHAHPIHLIVQAPGETAAAAAAFIGRSSRSG